MVEKMGKSKPERLVHRSRARYSCTSAAPPFYIPKSGTPSTIPDAALPLYIPKSGTPSAIPDAATPDSGQCPRSHKLCLSLLAIGLATAIGVTAGRIASVA
mmetsp:Transcript_35107/g.60526  ORF Transcript_35107/g.60526 Transcript_35107/m.60526 type:complete len:101 (-) Transcript_35107:367-669(-)